MDVFVEWNAGKKYCTGTLHLVEVDEIVTKSSMIEYITIIRRSKLFCWVFNFWLKIRNMLLQVKCTGNAQISANAHWEMYLKALGDLPTVPKEYWWLCWKFSAMLNEMWRHYGKCPNKSGTWISRCFFWSCQEEKSWRKAPSREINETCSAYFLMGLCIIKIFSVIFFKKCDLIKIALKSVKKRKIFILLLMCSFQP